jgi:hypothetical protein
MNSRPLIGRGVLVLFAAVTLIAVTIGGASAAPARKPGGTLSIESTSCTVQSTIFSITSCKTGIIHANGYWHRINYRMCAARGHYADWQVKDAHNGVIVGQGRVNAAVCTSGSIHGLYGDYWSWVFNTRDGASAYIDNA